MLLFHREDCGEADTDCDVRKLPRIEYNSDILESLQDLENIVNNAKKRWLGVAKPSLTADLLDKLSSDLLLVKRFVAEDNFEAVRLAWDVESLKPETFTKAFFYQKDMQLVAVQVRQEIINAMNATMERKANLPRIEDFELL